MKLRNPSSGIATRGKALSAGLTVLATCSVLSGTALGQTTPTATLSYGQVVQGALGDATDTVLADGRPIDRYTLTTQLPNQPYAIYATSPEVPIASTVMFFDPTTGQYVPLQRATNFAAGQRALYAGVLAQPGQYLIDVFAQDAQQPVGSYTLSLCGDRGDDDDDGDDLDDLDDLDGLDDCFDDDGDGFVGGVPGGAPGASTPGGGVGGTPAPGPRPGDDDRFDDDFDDRFDD